MARPFNPTPTPTQGPAAKDSLKEKFYLVRVPASLLPIIKEKLFSKLFRISVERGANPTRVLPLGQH